MKIKFNGKYNKDPDSLPAKPIFENSNKVIEAKNGAMVVSIFSLVILLIFCVIFCLRTSISKIDNLGVVLWILTIIPHEFIHTLAFKETVYLYTALPFGVFVYCEEHLSKSKFITMALLPNVIFGFIPFLIYLIFPSQNILGTMGLVAIMSGAGDYYNAFNVCRQAPKGAYIYMNKMDTYWYLPKVKEKG